MKIDQQIKKDILKDIYFKDKIFKRYTSFNIEDAVEQFIDDCKEFINALINKELIIVKTKIYKEIDYMDILPFVIKKGENSDYPYYFYNLSLLLYKNKISKNNKIKVPKQDNNLRLYIWNILNKLESYGFIDTDEKDMLLFKSNYFVIS